MPAFDLSCALLIKHYSMKAYGRSECKEPFQHSRCSGWPRAGQPRVRNSSPGDGKNFHFSMSSRPALGPTQSPIPWATTAFSSGVKRSGREADRSLPTSAEIKKTWLYTSTPP
jgi:hypothetical protein